MIIHLGSGFSVLFGPCAQTQKKVKRYAEPMNPREIEIEIEILSI